MENNDPTQQFPGFPPEPIKNYWEYPRIMNGYWHRLTGSEQKVLDYILRHTWGYKKNADFISYSQFMKGITKKNGEVLDRGCGIKSTKTLRKALKGLKSGGFIETIENAGKTIFYKLRIDKDRAESKELWEKVNGRVGESKEVGVGESKDTIEGITIKDYTKEGFSLEKLIDAYKKKQTRLKPYFRGEEMRWIEGKGWWVIPKDGGSWLEFAGKEAEIRWR